MPVTINVLWENKKYGVMLKVTWEQEVDLKELSNLLKNPLKQSHEVWKVITSSIFWAISSIKSKISSFMPKEKKEVLKTKNNRKYRNVKDYNNTRKNKKYYYKKPRIWEIV